MTYNFLETLYNDLMVISKTLVVKRADLAKAGETADTAKAFEVYLACVLGTRYFYTFAKYDKDILEKYVSKDILGACLKDTSQIPNAVRDAIVADQAARTIENYVERNPYYRVLMGLPYLNDHNWIYIKDNKSLPDNIPVHQYSIEQVSYMETHGILDQLKKDHSDKKYLWYLGSNSIDLITARLAKPFEILRIDTPANSNTKEMFENEYYMARRYVMATMYNNKLFAMKELYDPIMGTIILCLAIRNTMVPTEAAYLNFEEILNAILESYGLLQFFERLPFTYKKRLVMALDHILQNKGTDGVLLDLTKIFTYDNMTINRYHLMKTHATDDDGNVLFTGNLDKDYDLSFVKADVRDREIDYTEDNIIGYDTIVNNDYLWQLDKDEVESLRSEDFNTYMSKYIDIEAAYDLSALTFEVCYFINLLLDSRDNLARVRCTNMYSSTGYTNCYTMIIFLLAGLAKRSGFDGNIIYEPAHIAEILKFNFNDVSEELKKVIDSYELQIDVNQTLLGDYGFVLDKPSGLENQNTMVDIYLKNKELYDAIVQEMQRTNDYRQYIALSNAKDMLFISSAERKSFKKSDGEPANTYMEMLEDLDPKLANKINNCEDETELNNVLLYILEKLEELFNREELQYLFMNTPNTAGTLISRYLIKAINVFKASSVQLSSINVFFHLGDMYPVRVIDQSYHHINRYISDEVIVEDEIATHKTIVLDDYVNIGDKVYVNTK